MGAPPRIREPLARKPRDSILARVRSFLSELSDQMIEFAWQGFDHVRQTSSAQLTSDCGTRIQSSIFSLCALQAIVMCQHKKPNRWAGHPTEIERRATIVLQAHT